MPDIPFYNSGPADPTILLGIDGDDNVIENMNSGGLPGICRSKNTCTIENLNFNSTANTAQGFEINAFTFSKIEFLHHFFNFYLTR